MPTLSITRTYATNVILTKQDLDNICDSVETFVNTTKLNSSNIDCDSVLSGASSTGANAVASTMTSTGANAIATTITSTGADAIAGDMTVTGANSIAAVVSASAANLILGQGTSAAVIAAGLANTIRAARTTTTGVTVSAGGFAMSLSSGTYNLTTSSAQVTNLTVTLTTNGRPVELWLEAADGTGNGIFALQSSSSTPCSPTILFKRDSTTIKRHALTANVSNGNPISQNLPAGVFRATDTPTAGTYTYTVYAQLNSVTSVSSSFQDVILCARES